MRYGIGLLSLLIGVAILFYVSFGGPKGGEVGVTMQAKKNADEQAAQIAGRAMDGTPIQDTIKLDDVESGGQVRRLKVVSIIPNTPMETAYGLKAGDEISEVGPFNVRDDSGMAKSMLYEAYQRNFPLVIVRNDQTMTINPDSPLAKFHPGQFQVPGAVQNQSAPAAPSGQAIPTH